MLKLINTADFTFFFRRNLEESSKWNRWVANVSIGRFLVMEEITINRFLIVSATTIPPPISRWRKLLVPIYLLVQLIMMGDGEGRCEAIMEENHYDSAEEDEECLILVSLYRLVLIIIILFANTTGNKSIY